MWIFNLPGTIPNRRPSEWTMIWSVVGEGTPVGRVRERLDPKLGISRVELPEHEESSLSPNSTHL